MTGSVKVFEHPQPKIFGAQQPIQSDNTIPKSGRNLKSLDEMKRDLIHPRRLTAGTWKWWFGRWFSCFRGVFSGFMLIFQGCRSVNLYTSWWFQPVWNICSSNWISFFQVGGEHKKYLKPPPSDRSIGVEQKNNMHPGRLTWILRKSPNWKGKIIWHVKQTCFFLGKKNIWYIHGTGILFHKLWQFCCFSMISCVYILKNTWDEHGHWHWSTNPHC